MARVTVTRLSLRRISWIWHRPVVPPIGWWSPPKVNALITENGEYLLAEDGTYLTWE